MKRIKFRRINFSLGFRLSMGFTLIITLLLGAMGTVIYLRDREAFIEEFISRGWGIVRAVNGYAYQAIKAGDEKLIAGIVYSLVKEKYVMQAALLEKDGRVLASAGLKNPIPSNLKLSSNGWTKAVKDEKGNISAMVFLSPVTSEEGTVAGYLYLLCDFSPIAGYLQETLQYIVLNYAVACLLGLIMVRRIVRNFVERPVKVLMVATERVSIGDFSQKLQGLNNDELGKLASAFNNMMDQLGLLFGNIKNIVREMIQNSNLISQRSAYMEKYESNGQDAGRRSELIKEITTAARRIIRMGNQLDSLIQQFKTNS